MKVLRVLGLVFGILLLLTGAGLLAGSAVADRGQTAVEQEIKNQGLKGPVDGTVVSDDNGTFTVEYTVEDGTSYTSTVVSTMATPPEVGDTVKIFYSADDPTAAVISDAPVDALRGVAGTLRTAGIIALVLGALLLAASIVGFVLAKKRPAVLPAQPYAGSGQPAQQGSAGYPAPGPGGYPAPGPGAYQAPGTSGAPGAAYPPQQYRPQQPAQFPAQQSSPYPPQQPAPYPPQQQSSPYPPQPSGYPTPPPSYPPEPRPKN